MLDALEMLSEWRICTSTVTAVLQFYLIQQCLSHAIRSHYEVHQFDSYNVNQKVV
jgi:hypothetical protein